MEHFFHPIMLWLHTHPTWAGIVTCFITFFESLAILGIFIPGSVTLTAIGGLVGSGVVPAGQIFIWAIVGAILGDGISYWIGYRFHKSIRGVWPLTRFPGLLSKGEQFFAKHGGKGIFIGRFVGPIRPIMPLVAGMLRVKPSKFFTVDIISGILWAPVYMIPGILVGAASAHFAPDQAIHFIVGLLIAIVIVLLLAWLSRHCTRFIVKAWTHWMDFLWPKLRNSFPLTHKLLYEHAHPQRSRPLSLFLFALFFLSLFVILFICVRLHPQWLQNLDTSALTFFESFITPSVTKAAILISDYLGKSYVLLGTSFIVLLYLAYKRDWHACFIFASLIVVTFVCTVIFKHISHSVRPNAVIHPPTNYSFPSGHTLFAFTIFSYIGFLIGHITKHPKLKKLTYWLVAIIILLVFFSRLLLTVHWLTDVVGSVLLGSGLICLFVIAYRRKECHHRFTILPLVLLTLFGQLLFGSLYFAHSYQHDKQNLRLRHVATTVNPSTWWHAQHSILPIYRHNRFNKPVQVLNVQWFADITTIQQQLTAHGWKVAPAFGLNTIKQQLMGQAIVLSPFTPHFKYHKPVLVMTKALPQKDRYLVLRLWDGNYRTPLESIYVGNLSYHLPVQHWLWNHNAKCPTMHSRVLPQLTKFLRGSEWKMIGFTPKHSIEREQCISDADKILLIKAESY